jgi:L-amino acid N-acyltransferase
MEIVDCSEAYSAQILEILNDCIVNSTALYDYRPRTMENMKTWFETKRAGSFPIIGALDAEGKLMGFSSYGAFRNFPAYKYTVEHSVYVHKEHRGKNLGKILLQEIVNRAEINGLHNMIGAIDASNNTSIKLHESLGFTYSGTIREAGFKFGKWLDLVFYQKILKGPTDPKDG